MDSLLYHDHTAVIITALAVLITAVIFIWRYITYSPPPSSPTPPPPAVVDEPPVLAKLHKKPEHVKPLEHNHPLFIKHIKGHTDILTDVVFLRRVQGQTEPILVSSCRDRSIRKFETGFKHIERLSLTAPDTSSYNARQTIVGSTNEDGVSVLEVGVTKTGAKITEKYVTPRLHDSDVLCAGLSMTPSYIFSCGKDDTVRVHSTTGTLLTTAKVGGIKNTCADVSPNGDLIVVGTHLSDAKLYAISMIGSGDAKSVCFSHDGTRVMTCDSEHIYVYKVDVQYNKGADAELCHKMSIKIVHDIIASDINGSEAAERLLHDGFRDVFPSPSLDDVALACGPNLVFLVGFGTQNVRCTVVPLAHRGAPITRVTWDKSYVASTSNDRLIRIWKNPSVVAVQ